MVTQEEDQRKVLEESIRAERRALQDLCMEMDIPYNPVRPIASQPLTRAAGHEALSSSAERAA